MRLVDLPRRKEVLELGCGWGFWAEELARRIAQSRVVAIDREPAAIEYLAGRCSANVTARLADVHDLPSDIGRFDMIVSHFSFLWFRDPGQVLAACRRVLRDDGVILAIEPDYGGLMEYPDTGRREEWMKQLSAHQADPFIGRKMPALLRQQGLTSQVLFCDRYVAPRPPRGPLLADIARRTARFRPRSFRRDDLLAVMVDLWKKGRRLGRDYG